MGIKNTCRNFVNLRIEDSLWTDVIVKYIECESTIKIYIYSIILP